ncbi:hypothetical protein OAH18_02345 [bacterium]|nr:hypothetical protein [bacterium]
MPRESQPIGPCPKCPEGEAVCYYNFFDGRGVVIHSWEHKCANCGMRETTAYRSDDEEPLDEGVDPAVCPYCQRQPKSKSAE